AGLHEMVTAVEAGNYIDQLRGLSDADRRTEVEDRIGDTKHQIIESEAFCCTMAETNASDWDIDEYEVTGIDIDKENDRCLVRLTYKASGDQDPERMYYGTDITGEVEAVIDGRGDVIYQNVTAEVDHGDDAFGPDFEGEGGDD